MPRKKNVQGNWRGIEDKFFNQVRKGFIELLKPANEKKKVVRRKRYKTKLNLSIMNKATRSNNE
tara:strand:+ start:23872 stop:24063 length:192 start_codon:yes stop_codon:yes gene_type:complete